MAMAMAMAMAMVANTIPRDSTKSGRACGGTKLSPIRTILRICENQAEIKKALARAIASESGIAILAATRVRFETS